MAPEEAPPAAERGAATAQQEPAASERAGGQAAPRSVRRLDFSQPNKFTTELRRRIGAAMGSFCAELSGRLADELKCHVAMEVADVEQLTWVAAKVRLPADAPAVAVAAPAQPRQQMLLSVELAWLLQSIECLLGGQASQAPTERSLSDIDWALARDLLDALVSELSGVWGDLGGAELRRGVIDMEGDAGLLTPGPEPTLAVSLRSEIDGCGAELTLLIPWGCVEPIADGLRDGTANAPVIAEGGGEELGRGVADAKVLLRAEIGSVQMPIERMRQITEGTLLELGQRAEEGVRLFAEEVSLGRGRPGASGSHRALKLEAADDPPVRSETYARLGLADLQRARVPEQEADERLPVLHSMFVRVWAELGRTHMSLGAALELAPGSVVELDQPAQAPVEVFANGLCFASGRLVITPAGAWGVQVEHLV